MVYVFGELLLDIERRELRRGSKEIDLEPQVFDVLAHLLRQRDRVVGKDELFRIIWQGRAVSDSALTSRINAIRRAVGDDGRTQRVIRTFPRKGFRFVAPVEELPASPDAEPARPSRHLTAPALAERPSIAVMPFAFIGQGPRKQWVARAVVENVLVALSRFRWLSVRASSGFATSSQSAPDGGRSAPEARYLVQGTVLRSGSRRRLTVRLVEAATGVHLWAERFDRVETDDFEWLDRAAATIAGSLDSTIELAEARRSDATSEAELTAFELRLRAQPILSLGKASILRSLGLLEKAIALDPTCAPALADAANCLQLLDINGWAKDRRSNRQKALDYARRALQFASDAEPVATAAHVFAYFSENIDAALGLGEQAVSLNPNNARGRFSHGMARLYAGRLDEALASFEASIRLSPRDLRSRRNVAGVGLVHFLNRRFDEAIPRLRLMAQEFPYWATPYCALASSYAHLGHGGEARTVAARLKAADAALAPTASQFQQEKHRELFAPGLALLRR